MLVALALAVLALRRVLPLEPRSRGRCAARPRRCRRGYVGAHAARTDPAISQAARRRASPTRWRRRALVADAAAGGRRPVPGRQMPGCSTPGGQSGGRRDPAPPTLGRARLGRLMLDVPPPPRQHPLRPAAATERRRVARDAASDRAGCSTRRLRDRAGRRLFRQVRLRQPVDSPPVRVALGMPAGSAFVGVGRQFIAAASPATARSLTGGGVGILYLAITAAYQWYALVGRPLAFGVDGRDHALRRVAGRSSALAGPGAVRGDDRLPDAVCDRWRRRRWTGRAVHLRPYLVAGTLVLARAATGPR